MRLITTGGGAVVATTEYLPYGQDWQPTGPLDRRGFAGMERTPDTGNASSWENLSYIGARYYHPQIGRFISVDPGHVGGRLEDPQSWHGYADARNNPLIYIDPTGMMYEVCVFAGSCFETSDGQLRQAPEGPRIRNPLS